MTLYANLQSVSDQLLQQFGQACTVKTQGEGKYNATTGEFKASGEISRAAYCLFDHLAYDFSFFKSGGVGKGESSAVQHGDVLIYITASGQPSVNSVVDVNGEQWAILRCQPISPAGSALLYQCQGRKR